MVANVVETFKPQAQITVKMITAVVPRQPLDNEVMDLSRKEVLNP